MISMRLASHCFRVSEERVAISELVLMMIGYIEHLERLVSPWPRVGHKFDRAIRQL